MLSRGARGSASPFAGRLLTTIRPIRSVSQTTPNINAIMSKLVAVGILIDSSFALAAEWALLLKDYVSPMMSRMGELHPGFQVRFVREFRQKFMD